MYKIELPTNSRLTKQRQIILDEIKKLTTHPTAEELYKIVAKKLPKINISTIYRNLEFLEENNLIIRLETKDKKARYDGNICKHLHLICKKCGEVVDVFDCEGVEVASKKLKQSGFQPEFGYLEIPGICKKCQSKK